MLDCCEPLEKVKAKGIAFGKVVCLARCAGAKVEAFRSNQSTIDDFRKFVVACCTSDNCHVISSYNRRNFQQAIMTFSFNFWFLCHYCSSFYFKFFNLYIYIYIYNLITSIIALLNISTLPLLMYHDVTMVGAGVLVGSCFLFSYFISN